MRITRYLVPLAAALAVTTAAADEPSPFASPATETLLVAQGADALGEVAGRVVVTTSGLRATREDGSSRELSRRSEIYAGDTLVTGADGITQVRMQDGALLALRSQTEFKIEEFNHDPEQPDAERGFFNLLKGGLRTITGTIGKSDPANYRINTGVATIGIRGTHFGLRLCQQGDCADEGVPRDGLYGGTVDGSIVTENNTGLRTFTNDQYFHVASIDSRGRSLLAPPAVVFGTDLPQPSADAAGGDEPVSDALKVAHPEDDEIAETAWRDAIQEGQNVGLEFYANNQSDPDTPPPPPPSELQVFLEDLAPGTVAPSDTTMILGFLGDDQSNNVAIDTYASVVNVGNVDQSGDALQDLIALNNLGGTTPAAIYAHQGCGADLASCQVDLELISSSNPTLASTGSNATFNVSWGRWDTGWTTDVAPDGTFGSAHFMVTDQLTVQLPSSGTVTYNNVLGGTNPTNQAGVEGTLTSMQIGVDFGAQSITSYDAAMNVGGDVVTITNTQSTQISAAAQSGGLTLTGNCAGAVCGSSAGLGGSASVNFVGTNADAAITNYSVQGVASDSTAIGYAGAALVGR